MSPSARVRAPRAPHVLPVGLGYRRALHDELMELDPGLLDFVELAPENYVGLGGHWKRRLDHVKSRWPIITHGFAMSLGGLDPLDARYLEEVAAFVESTGATHHSDHACWSSAHGSHLHELLPMPYTKDSARHLAARVREAQASFGVPLAIENVSSYLRQPEDTLDEPDFLSEVVERAGCGILLDVNNVFVNAHNFHRDPYAQLRRMPAEAAVQIHVAGFHVEDELYIDTHGAPVADGVWPLLEEALRRTGPVPVLLERDNDIPALAELMAELDVIRAIGARVFPHAEVQDG
ncbi:DUF692 domain-containing protein [Myxococcota bacterium]|nr:DUF692 domain-containing protein [Myxococcota bacterium]